MESNPGIGAKRATRIKAKDNYTSLEELELQIDGTLPDWMKHAVEF